LKRHPFVSARTKDTAESAAEGNAQIPHHKSVKYNGKTFAALPINLSVLLKVTRIPDCDA